MNGTCYLKPVFYTVCMRYRTNIASSSLYDGTFGPYSDRRRAEECCTELATRSDVASAEIVEDVPTAARFKEETS